MKDEAIKSDAGALSLLRVAASGDGPHFGVNLTAAQSIELLAYINELERMRHVFLDALLEGRHPGPWSWRKERLVLSYIVDVHGDYIATFGDENEARIVVELANKRMRELAVVEIGALYGSRGGAK